MTSLLFYPGMGPAVLTLAELKSFIIKYDKLSEIPAQKLPEVDMIMKRKTLQWKNTKNYYEVKLAESSMFAF
jgi:hypothetical protein